MQSAKRHARHQVEWLDPSFATRQTRVDLVLDELGDPGEDAGLPEKDLWVNVHRRPDSGTSQSERSELDTTKAEKCFCKPQVGDIIAAHTNVIASVDALESRRNMEASLAVTFRRPI